jgi:transcriptional regulator with XRE-family HTH domain
MTTLKQLRKKRGISQGALAQLLQEKRGGKGLQGPVSVIESGKVSPTVKRLADILDALGYRLELTAKARGVSPISLDLASLLGNGPGDPPAEGPPRAKDTPEKEANALEATPNQSSEVTLEHPLETSPVNSIEGLESLLLTIINK